MEYEEAAKYRDYINAFKALGETQRATMATDRDIDVLLPLIAQNSEIIAQYKVREGKLIGREIHYMNEHDSDLSSTRNEMVSAFIKQYYTGSAKLPKEILLTEHIDEEELVIGLLNNTNEENAKAKSDTMHHTKIIVPERGEKKAILDLAINDSLQVIKGLDERAERDAEKKDKLRDEITRLIKKAAQIEGSIPYIIEMEMIANIESKPMIYLI